MQLVFDDAKARQLFGTLQDLYAKKEGVYKNIVLPEDRFPVPKSPRKLAHWYFFTVLTQRGGITSEDPYKWAYRVMGKYPELFFSPKAVADKWSPGKIAHVIMREINTIRGKQAKQHKLIFPNGTDGVASGRIKSLDVNDSYKLGEFANSWFNNAVVLHRKWKGNVLNVFEGVKDFEEAFERIDYYQTGGPFTGFIGMRRKIFSLFTVTLQKDGLIPIFPTPIPVDFHALRLLFATEVITLDGVEPFKVNPEIHPLHFEGRIIFRVTERMIDQITMWSQKFIFENGFSHIMVNPALWVLSRELCPRELQAQASGGRREKMILNYPEDLESNPELWPIGYNDPALHCPIAHLCKRVVPNAPYYHYGMIMHPRRVGFRPETNQKVLIEIEKGPPPLTSSRNARK